MNQREQESRVQATFDSVAQAYDHPVMSWFDRTATAMTSALSLESGDMALDLATGTGKVAIAIAQANPNVHVLGIDLSQGMLTEAAAKAERLGLTNLRFKQGSFTELGELEKSESEKFNAVTCSFGLFFVDAMTETLRHFATQLTSDGSVVLSSFALGAFSPFSEEFLKLYGQFRGEVQDARWLRLSSEELLRSVFQDAGLESPSIERHDFGFELEQAEAWWEIVSSAGYRGMLNTLNPEQQVLFKVQHLAEVEQLMKGGHRRLNVEVLISRARRQR